MLEWIYMLQVSAAESLIAYTNLINVFVSVFCMGYLFRKGLQIRRNMLWFLSYLFLMLNSFIGFVLHGFPLPPFVNIFLWSFLYLLLGIMLGRYVLALRHDVLDEKETSGIIKKRDGLFQTASFVRESILDAPGP